MMWKILTILGALVAVEVGAQLVGGFAPADINSLSVRNALNFAVSQYNKASNHRNLAAYTNVVKAQQQVVSGMKYRFTVQMATTTCANVPSQTDCPISNEARPFQCEFDVWTQPWRGFISLERNKCTFPQDNAE